MPRRQLTPGRYGPKVLECPVCGAAVPRDAGSCYACGYRFHYWYVGLAVMGVVLVFLVAAVILYLSGGRR